MIKIHLPCIGKHFKIHLRMNFTSEGGIIKNTEKKAVSINRVKSHNLILSINDIRFWLACSQTIYTNTKEVVCNNSGFLENVVKSRTT